MSGAEQIAAERQRQVDAEGLTPEHDDAHDSGELVAASWCYMTEHPAFGGVECGDEAPDAWPWQPEDWKPSDDPIRNLVKAGALIAAEIDRLQRPRQQGDHDTMSEETEESNLVTYAARN